MKKFLRILVLGLLWCNVSIAGDMNVFKKKIKLPNDQQNRDMIARELLVKFQMSPNHPLVDLKKAYLKF